MAAGAALVFLTCMKELPATLLLRPANFDTLATWLYAEAARGSYEEGALAALAIVLAGLAPVLLLARTQFVQAAMSSTPAADAVAPSTSTSFHPLGSRFADFANIVAPAAPAPAVAAAKTPAFLKCLSEGSCSSSG